MSSSPRRKAQAVIEFAIVLPVAILLVLGMVNVYFFVSDHISLDTAVREAVRVSIDRPSYVLADEAARGAFTSQLWASRMDTSRATVSVRMLGGAPYGEGELEVSATYASPLRIANLTFLPAVITMSSQLRGQTIRFIERSGTRP